MPMMTSMAEVPTIRIAVLDDYQQVASRVVDWAAAVPQAEVTFFADHLADPDQLAVRLAGFDVVVAMRERTAFERRLGPGCRGSGCWSPPACATRPSI